MEGSPNFWLGVRPPGHPHPHTLPSYADQVFCHPDEQEKNFRKLSCFIENGVVILGDTFLRICHISCHAPMQSEADELKLCNRDGLPHNDFPACENKTRIFAKKQYFFGARSP